MDTASQTLGPGKVRRRPGQVWREYLYAMHSINTVHRRHRDAPATRIPAATPAPPPASVEDAATSRNTSTLWNAAAAIARHNAFLADPAQCHTFLDISASARSPLWLHQEQAVLFMRDREENLVDGGGGILGDDMRMGKTRDVVHCTMRDTQRIVRMYGPSARSTTHTLIVCASDLVDTWWTEFSYVASPRGAASSAHGLTVMVVTTSSAQRHDTAAIGTLVAHHDVIITTPDTLLAAHTAADKHALVPLLHMKWHRLVVDEAHLIINSTATQHRDMLMQLTAQHRWFVSGTPLMNRLADMAAALTFIGVTVSAEDAKSETALRAICKRAMIRRMKKDVAHTFVEPTRVLLDFATSGEACLYIQACHEYRHRRRTNMANLGIIQRLRQLVISPWRVSSSTRTRLLDAYARRKRIDTGRADWQRMVAKVTRTAPFPTTKLRYVVSYYTRFVAPTPGDKLVVFADWVHALVYLQTLLPAAAGAQLIEGNCRPDERTHIVDVFQHTDACRCLLVSTRLGAHGINLSRANHVILLDMQWNPAVETQALQRVQTLGPRADARPLTLQCLAIRNTIDAHVTTRSDAKRLLAASVLNDDEEGQHAAAVASHLPEWCDASKVRITPLAQQLVPPNPSPPSLQ